MPSFADYEAMVEPLRLPYRGTIYEIPPVGLKGVPTLLAAIENPAESTLTGDELRRLLLGAAWDRMVADDVPPGFAVRAEMTALADFRAGREAAELMWATGADPLAVEGWIAARTPATPPSDAAAASTTPTPTSGSGTRPSRTKRAAAPAS